jgi:hypothetical protein
MKLLEVYGDKVLGAIKGLDRIRFRGALRWLANVNGMRGFLSHSHILLKDFSGWAQSKTSQVRQACAQQAQALGIPTQYLRSSAVDKEKLARAIAAEHNLSEGPLCQLSVVEPCWAPMVVGERATKKLELEYRPRKCVFIYHYFDDPQVGFGHVRLQTWMPLPVSICLNGRHWLEKQLKAAGLGYLKDGNCFPWLENVAAAQRLMDEQLKTDWPVLLERLVLNACPGLDKILAPLDFSYYWSAEETEWATDAMFKSAAELESLYPLLIRHGLLVSDSPAVLRYLGRGHVSAQGKIQGRVPEQIQSDCRRRHEGVRLKHWVGRNSVKAYNKAGNRILRVETTINNTRDFKVFRAPEKHPEREMSWQRLRKGVADLHRRCQISDASNERYGAALAAAAVEEKLGEVAKGACRRVLKDGRSHRALNPWNELDYKLLTFLGRGELALNGFRNKDLRAILEPEQSATLDEVHKRRLSAKATRCIGLLRAHGLIRKVSRTSRYVLTEQGRKFTTALLSASATDVKTLMELAA